MNSFEAPALPGFGRDYSQANWNRQVAGLLRQYDAHHALNVARARRLMGGPRALLPHQTDSFLNWLGAGPIGPLYVPSGSVPVSMYGAEFENEQPPWLRSEQFRRAGARATAGAVGW